MAIVFTQDISTTNWLNAYNNNVVVFSTNSGKTATKATITIGTVVIEITPNPSGVFRYNFKSLLRALVDNRFIDSASGGAFSYNDSDLGKTYTATILMTFSDTTTETINRTINVLKRVEQIGEGTSLVKANQTVLNGTSLVMWQGYPFTVEIATSNAYNVTSSNGEFFTVTPSQPISRLQLHNINYLQRFINDGYTIEPVCVAYPFSFIPLGFSTVTIGSTSVLVESRLACSDAQYLKWFNTKLSCWSYWMFNPIYRTGLNVKTKDTYNVDNDNLSLTSNTELITGKDSTMQRTLMTEDLSTNDKSLLTTLLESPKVELYKNGTFQSVLISDGSFEVENTKVDSHKLTIGIMINRYSY